MGLLNHLFGNKSSIARELALDGNKRMALWNKHLANWELREKLSVQFNYKNVDAVVKNFNATKEILDKIAALIPPELVNIADEEKTDAEISEDLERLKGMREIESIYTDIVLVQQKQALLRTLFREILNVLKAELHLIKLIKKKPTNLRELLLKLFMIIFHNEAQLYKIFREQCFSEEHKHVHPIIARIARAIILEEKIVEEMETDEEKFARQMVKQMADESMHAYRKLGEDIFYELARLAGAPMGMGEDIVTGIARMEGHIRNDGIMYRIVKRLRPKYTDVKIRGVILAFRMAYGLGHFEGLSAEFAT